MNIVEEFRLDRDNFVWQDMAMCHNIPIDAFFDDAESNENIKNAVKEVCGYCPVRSMCESKALAEKQQGIWGGHTISSGGRIID